MFRRVGTIINKALGKRKGVTYQGRQAQADLKRLKRETNRDRPGVASSGSSVAQDGNPAFRCRTPRSTSSQAAAAVSLSSSSAVPCLRLLQSGAAGGGRGRGCACSHCVGCGGLTYLAAGRKRDEGSPAHGERHGGSADFDNRTGDPVFIMLSGGVSGPAGHSPFLTFSPRQSRRDAAADGPSQNEHITRRRGAELCLLTGSKAFLLGSDLQS